MPFGAAIGAGVLGAGSSIFGGKQQRKAANAAAKAQLQATREALAQQKELAEKGFQVYETQANRATDFLRQQNALARNELAPIREVGLQNLERLSALTDPNSAETQQARALAQKQIAQNLSARGLTASGEELGQLGNLEAKLESVRRNTIRGLAGQGVSAAQGIAGLQTNLGQNLAQLSQGLGSGALNLYGNLGSNQANTLISGATNANQLRMAGANAATQGLLGAGNAAQGTAQNLIMLKYLGL